ncbi:MAG: AarF/ABC1/UbiB kinase family protein [Chloroflexi bacterium]|nr:AarF/ABC1/UbiB kinase family protein [Chloroflexota bacterium]
MGTMIPRWPYRHLRRYRQVVLVLARHGFGALVDQLGLSYLAPFHWLQPTRVRATQPEHLRMALEELGTTFIKLGQILSTRPDLLPADYVAELAKLRETVPPVPVEAIRSVVEAELGKPLAALFRRFDPVPIASASIGQVHGAVLPTGEAVVVKVQKPGVEEQVATDLEILADLATLAARRTALGELYNLPALAEEFAWTLRNELDYAREGRNADVFRRNFRGDPNLYVPDVFWDATTRRVIVLERIAGIKLDQVAALEAAGFDRHTIARRSARIILKEVFEHGFFHADPHPGNFSVLPSGAIGAMDFGMVGRLEEDIRDNLLLLMTAIVRQDASRAVDALEELGIAGRRVQRAALRRNLAHLLDRYYGLTFREINAAMVIGDLFALIRRHRLVLPPELSLLLKTITMNEGIGRQLDPSFNMVEEAAPYVRKATLQRYSPWFWGERLGRTALDISYLPTDLPIRLHRLLRTVERGQLLVSTHHDEWEHELREINRMVNRLSLSLLAASVIISLALLLQLSPPAGLGAVGNWLLGLGLLLIALMGLYLLLATWRAGRR